MNTVDTIVGGATSNALEARRAILEAKMLSPQAKLDKSQSVDIYTGSAANEAIFAKAFENVLRGVTPMSNGQVAERSKFVGSESTSASQITFNTDALYNTVMHHVTSAIKAHSERGANTEQLEYMRSQAIDGVTVGFANAIAELRDATGQDFEERLREPRDKILAGLQNIDVMTVNIASTASVNKIKVKLNNGENAVIGFSPEVVFADAEKMRFTTEKSNLSFSVEGISSSDIAKDIADTVNQIDRVINAFYREDVESAFNRLAEKGIQSVFSQRNLTLVPLPNVTGKANKYTEIKNLDPAQKMNSADINVVKEYTNTLSDTRQQAKNVFASQNEFKQVLAGIVSQLKDVQVPDLLKAINRLHAFNAKL